MLNEPDLPKLIYQHIVGVSNDYPDSFKYYSQSLNVELVSRILKGITKLSRYDTNGDKFQSRKGDVSTSFGSLRVMVNEPRAD
jgi:hypothetical protein